ncbi:MAG: TonB-dependent receptor [Rikenellaceae bacterium]
MRNFTFSCACLNRGVLVLCLLLAEPFLMGASAAESYELSDSSEQQRNLSGIIKDTQGVPIVGATVLLKGTSKGDITNAEGKFNVTVNSADPKELLVSFMGYKTKTIAIPATVGNLNIVLESDNLVVDEVVVVGYGTQRKANLTGAVMQVGSEELVNRPVANVSQMLQGALPNVNITFSTGAPDATGKINIRGQASINGGDPLVLIDGVPGSIDRINPSDIESVSVLKDASASAIYGARGAFGVILVTTKKAKSGNMSVSYSGFFAMSSPTVSTNFMTNGYESTMLNDEAFLRAVGNTYTRYSEEDYHELEIRRYDKTENPDRPWTVVKEFKGKQIYNYYGSYDWWNTIFNENQPSHSHSINMSGGNDKINFMLSGNYYAKDGIMRIDRDKYKRYNFRSKVEAKLFPFLKVYNNTQYFDSKYKYSGNKGGGNSNFVNITVHALPAYAPMNPDGTATYNTMKNNYSIGDGQFAMLLDGDSKGENSIHEFRTSTGLEASIGKHFKITGDYTFAAYMKDNWYRRTVAEYSIEPGKLQQVPNYNTDQYEKSMSFDPMHVLNGYVNYTQSFKKHNISAMAGVNYEAKNQGGMSASRKNLISESLNDLNLGTGDMTVGGGASEYVLFGAFVRANYDYDGKYLFEFSGRYDGTSKYKQGMRYGFFPSVSAGWRISEEKFFAGAKNAVNNLKIRASYGTLGNQLSGSNYYPYISTMGMSLDSWLIDGAKTQSISAPAPIAPNLTWEKVISTNIGLDASFLKNRLNFTVDAYIRDTKDMLVPGQTLPSVFGATSPKQNSGDLRTKGYEIMLSWRDNFQVGSKPFNYNASFVLGDAVSEITKYDNPTNLLSNHYVGKKIGEIWGYEIGGLFKTQAEADNYKVNQKQVNSQIQKAPGEWGKLRAGDMWFVDRNADGSITRGKNTLDDPGDRKIIGNSEPRYNYGLNLGADWNGIDFSIFFQGVGRRNWYPNSNADKFWGPYSRPYYSFLPENFTDKIWSEENPNSYFPLLRGYTALNGGGSLNGANNRYLQNIGYLRIKNIVLGYSLPTRLLNKAKIQRLRIYASAENLVTWTPFETKYIDPEQPIADSNGRSYPLSKTFSFGLDITF